MLGPPSPAGSDQFDALIRQMRVSRRYPPDHCRAPNRAEPGHSSTKHARATPDLASPSTSPSTKGERHECPDEQRLADSTKSARQAASHRALDEIARGMQTRSSSRKPSRRCHAGEPYGPPPRGGTQIEQAGRRAASNYLRHQARDLRQPAGRNAGDGCCAASGARSAAQGARVGRWAPDRLHG